MVRNAIVEKYLRNGKECCYWYVINMKKWLRWAIIAIIVRTIDQANTYWRYKDTEESESEKP